VEGGGKAIGEGWGQKGWRSRGRRGSMANYSNHHLQAPIH